MSDYIRHIDLNFGAEVKSQSRRYILRNELGEGGFGSVYHVTSETGDHALKIVKLWKIPPDQRKEYITRINQEYEIASTIDSNHVVKSIDKDFYEGNPFIIMELCMNGSMRNMFDNPSESQGKRLALDILSGLHSLHEQGIIHRDIKPDNILLDVNNRAKLVDFGISGSIKKRLTKVNVLGYVKEVFATLSYSPPEQTDAAKAFSSMSPRNDIYSFGVTMYEYFTRGELPFGSFDNYRDNYSDFDRRKRKNKWDRDTLKKSVNGKIWPQIIEKCLQPKPEDRFKTCEDIAKLLGAFEPDRNSKDVQFGQNSIWILKVMQGDEVGREYNLSICKEMFGKDKLTIGWFNMDIPHMNDLGLTETYTSYISRRHATLIFDNRNNQWSIMDGQDVNQEWKYSTNGVLVNSDYVEKKKLRLYPGDIITIGDTTLKVIVK